MMDPGVLSEPSVKRKYNQLNFISTMYIWQWLMLRIASVYTGRLGQALDMMNHAVSGTLLPGVRENMAYFTSTERRLVRNASLHSQHYWQPV